MSVKNTKGLTIMMSGTTTLGTLALADGDGISNAKPAVVSAASTTGLVNGQIITVAGSGWPELDGKSFIVDSLAADATFILLGSDTSGQAAPILLAAAVPAVVFTFYDDTVDMTGLCLSTVSINGETGSPVSVGTFCDPTATVPGLEAGAGTVDLAFWLDKDSAGYAALLEAEADGNERTFKVMFPDNGYLIMKGTVGSISFTDMPLDGAVALSANVTLSTKPIHVF